MSKKRKLDTDKLAAPIALIKQAGEKWSSTFVPRSQVPLFTGGLYTVGTMANADSLKNGVPGAFRVGRQVCYPVSGLVDWLIARVEV